MEIINLNQYKQERLVQKQAAVLYNHLSAILLVLNLTERGLSMFCDYVPVYKILLIIKSQKQLLELHYEKYKKIQETSKK